MAHPPGAYAAQPSASFGESSVAIADPSRKLQAGDQLMLKIEQDHEGAVAVLVSTTGEVVVDPIPQTIHVSGLTLSQATNEIKRLLEKDYYYTATVRLSLERASNPVAGSISIDGEVNRRGPQPLFEGKPLKLSKAINAAGGFTHDANMRKVRVTRVGKDGTAQVFTCDMKAVIQESKVEKDFLLQDGDSVFVPRNIIID